MLQDSTTECAARSVGLELTFDAGNALVDDGDGFGPGFEGVGGVADVEGAGMGLFGGVFAPGFFESLFEVGEPLAEVFFAHSFRLHRCGSGDFGLGVEGAGFDVPGQAEEAEDGDAVPVGIELVPGQAVT